MYTEQYHYDNIGLKPNKKIVAISRKECDTSIVLR